MTSTGNLRRVYEACRDGSDGSVKVGTVVGQGEVAPLMVDIVPELRAAWYVLVVAPGRERTVAGHLIGRRVGVYLPEFEERISNLRTGRRQTVSRPMFAGYLFTFAWLSPRNYHRIRDVPGALDFLTSGQAGPAVVPDELIDRVRAVENKLRPLVVSHEGFGHIKRVKRGWRRYRTITDQRVADHEIVRVRTWSALLDGIVGLDGDARNRLLRESLGLAA
jgi:transcription antitermination factor NusG